MEMSLSQRKPIRWSGYDYSQAGLYFITICVQNRARLFGNVCDEEMILNEAGRMIIHWYYELENKFPDVACSTMMVMPDHFHCIILKKERRSGAYTLCRVIQWFKTMTTNDYIRRVKQGSLRPFIGNLWQRNYWEHLIQNQEELDTITEYILTNPQRWDKDI